MRSFSGTSLRFHSGESSPVSFLQGCLERIEQREEEVQAFEYLKTDGAIELARESEKRWRTGKQRSAVDGMPIGIKDIIETRDMPTQCGSPYFKDYFSGRDSASVSALRDAGGIILGKTATTEFAGPFASKTRNPWNLAHTPGGSSSGSAAAVASGMLPAALGTQVIGSIIRPASYCGTYAIKPSVGAINRGGSHDNLSQSAHGVLSASLEDGWNVLREIARRVGGDPGHRAIDKHGRSLETTVPRRVGVIKTRGYDSAEPYARDFLKQLAHSLAGANVEVVWSEDDPLLTEIEKAISDAQSESLEIVGCESIWPLKAYLEQDETMLSPILRDRVIAAEKRDPNDYNKLLKRRKSARQTYSTGEGTFDAFITLSATGTAPAGLDSTGDTIFNTPASYLGVPSVNLPLFTREGLPLGLQVMGYAQSDYELVCIAEGIRGLQLST
ncbi:amidase [Paramicrobacterium chengjingii]|uniref:amidase n=1 Tax=Paramicrobacterium chengjingii TaxID=2769067 RepID=UPI001F1A3DA9|nr:amidase [Microbacterium chengjingii]